MSEIFLKLFNMSITASWIILAVIVLRVIFKKAPTWINLILWAVVALRLVVPFSFESVLSLVPSTQTVSPDIMFDKVPEIDSGISIINNIVNPVISESFAPQPMTSANPLQILIPVTANFWLLGVIIMLLYSVISYVRLNRRVKISLLSEDNIYFCDNIASPFILGVLKPKIYLPSSISKEEINYVIKHEKAHIKRKDHFIKPIGFAILSVYWFNPFVWLGYILLCRDIEKACDEKVIKNLDTEGVKGYLNALVSCSVQRRMVMACPLAFGEVGVKQRIKSVLNYKRAEFWIVAAAIITCVVTAICFLTNPIGSSKQLFKNDTQWWCNNYNASFYVDAEGYISGFITTEKETINFDVKINSNNARFVNTLTDEDIITAKIQQRNGVVAFMVKENSINLDTSELVFTKSVVTVKVGANSNLLVFFGDKAQVFKDVLDKASWIEGTTDCMSEFSINYTDDENKLELLYHSDCGTFNDTKTNKSFTLSEEDKNAINAILFEHETYFSKADNTLESVISNAIISNNKSNKPTGLLGVESHVILGQVSSTPLMNGTFEVQKFYMLALYQEFNVSSGDPIEVRRDFSPVILTLYFSKDEGYSLEEYQVMSSNKQIEEMFPDENSIYDAINKTEFLGQLEERNTQKVKERMGLILHQSGHYLYEYDACVSFANYTNAQQLYISCLNRIKMYISSVCHLPIFKFETKSQLDDFKSSFKDDLTFNHGYNEVPSFNEVAEKYDEDYFKEKTLLLVYVGASSGSFRYGVNSVYNDGKNFCIHIETTNNPEVCTADMSGWFITVGVDKSAVENCTTFDADLDNF